MPVIVLTGAGFLPFVLLGLAAAFPNAVNIILNIIGLTFWGIVGLIIAVPALLIVFLILCAKYEDKTGRPLKWVRRFAGEREIRQN